MFDRSTMLACVDRAIQELTAMRRQLAGSIAPCDEPTGPSGPEVEAKVSELKAACADLGIEVTFDGYIGEIDAARLLRKAPQTLRNWRLGSDPIPWRKPAGRIQYRLHDLAFFLLSGK